MKTLPEKIAIVSDAIYPFNTGGKEKRIYDITTRLAAQGYKVTIYCMHWWPSEEKSIIKDGVTFYAISPYYRLYAGTRRSLTEAIFFAVHCFKIINKDFDVVEVDHMPHLVLFTMKIVCMLKRKQMIVTWHEVWGKAYWKEYLGSFGVFAYWVERITAQLPDLIVSVSERTTKKLRSVLGRTKEIVTIPNGLDMQTIEKSSPSNRKSNIIFAGRLLANKNVDTLLHAINYIKASNPDISLFVVGEGPEKEKLETLSRDLRLQSNVVFFNFFGKYSDLYGLMKSSQLFVLPSTREGFGIVVLEANACGLPVLTIRHPDNAAEDLIQEGQNGVLTSLDQKEMATAIQTSLDTPRSSDLYRAYAEKYDWDSILSKVQQVYMSTSMYSS